MHKIFIYSLLLIIGITASQTAHLAPYQSYLHFFTLTLLAYIMIEVGTEFDLNPKNLKNQKKKRTICGSASQEKTSKSLKKFLFTF